MDDPDDPSRTITDIDLIEGYTLWEEKSARWAIDPTAWAQANIIAKFERYVEARTLLPAFYRECDIGFRFESGASREEAFDPAFRDAID